MYAEFKLNISCKDTILIVSYFISIFLAVLLTK